MDAQARVRALYGVMQSIENKLGGGEGVEGLYGSVNKGGMAKVINALCSKCGLDANSRLVDIGAGLGRPLLHALVEPGIAGGYGVEIDRIKCDKAVAFLRQAVAELERRGVSERGVLELPVIECNPIEQIKTLDPCTHAYSFWEGVPFEGKMAFGRLFAASHTLHSVAVVQRAMRGEDPAEAMEELGFGQLELVDSFSVSMSGSGRSFTAYVFNRVVHPLKLPTLEAVEEGGAEGVNTPTLSQEPEPAVPADSEAGQRSEDEEGGQREEGEARPSEAGDSSAAVAAAGAVAAEAKAAAGRGAGGLRSQASAAAGAEVGGVSTARPQQLQQQQLPPLGRGARRATQSRKAAETTAAAAAEVEAAAAAVGVAGGKGGGRKGGSPQKSRGVQKKSSPRQQAPMLLPEARIRRPRAAAAGKGISGGKEAAGSAAGAGAAPPQPAVRRGLLA